MSAAGSRAGREMEEQVPALPGAVIEQLTALGPFFSVDTHPPSAPVSRPWRIMREVVADPALLAGRITTVRAHLAVAGGQAPDRVPLRVAASVTQLGLVARLASPALALAVATGQVPVLDLTRLRWQPLLGGPFPLSLPAATLTRRVGTDHRQDEHPAAEHLAAQLVDRVINGPIREIVEATRPFSVSTRVLWGNVASALHGAASMIAAGRAAWASRAHALASGVLDTAPLRGTGTLDAHQTFRRRSCCLIYHAAPNAKGPVCGDCILAADRTR